MAEVKRKFIIRLTGLMMALGFGGAAVFAHWMPDHYPHLYPAIPFFFYLYGLAFAYVYGLFPDKWLPIQIAGKGVKLLLGLLFVVAYAQFVGVRVKEFLLVFLCYYIIYLVFECTFFLKEEMEMKKRKGK